MNLTISGNISTMFNLAKCKFLEKDYKLAKEHIESILKIFPEHEETNELLKQIKEEETK